MLTSAVFNPEVEKEAPLTGKALEKAVYGFGKGFEPLTPDEAVIANGFALPLRELRSRLQERLGKGNMLINFIVDEGNVYYSSIGEPVGKVALESVFNEAYEIVPFRNSKIKAR